LNLILDDNKNEIYLSEKENKKANELVNSYKNPIALNISSSRQTKQWYRNRWKKVVEKLSDFTFIQLGDINSSSIKGTVDLRGKTTIREAIAIVKHSKLLVGVDSFLNHCTTAVGTKGVVIFGPTSPENFGYKENINIYKGCKTYNCDIKYSRYCPNNMRCMKNVTTDEVIENITNSINV